MPVEPRQDVVEFFERKISKLERSIADLRDDASDEESDELQRRLQHVTEALALYMEECESSKACAGYDVCNDCQKCMIEAYADFAMKYGGSTDPVLRRALSWLWTSVINI